MDDLDLAEDAFIEYEPVEVDVAAGDPIAEPHWVLVAGLTAGAIVTIGGVLYVLARAFGAK
jgi:hypothetical protein